MKIRVLFSQLKQTRLAAFALITIVIIGAIVYAIYLRFVGGLDWADWTGLGAYYNAKGEYERAKTLWDWMELLLVPFFLAIGVWWLTKSDNETERVLSTDRQQQATLESYFEHMSSLLLDNNLRESKEGAEVRSIARARTLAVLRSLDSARRSLVLMFLKEAHLIDKENVIVDLSQADFSQISLEPGFQGVWSDYGWGFDLSNAHLSQVKLNGADLYAVNLQGADLAEADLSDSILSYTDLGGANLYQTIFKKTNLSGANLREAWLKNAIIIDTNLKEAYWDKNLRLAAFFKNTIMPDGSKHDRSWFEEHTPKDSW